MENHWWALESENISCQNVCSENRAWNWKLFQQLQFWKFVCPLNKTFDFLFCLFCFCSFSICQVGYLHEVILKVLNLVLLLQSYWDRGTKLIKLGWPQFLRMKFWDTHSSYLANYYIYHLFKFLLLLLLQQSEIQENWRGVY